MEEKYIPDILKQVRLPVIAAPMFLISSPQMVIEACLAGIIGSFPALNARSAELLDEWMGRITQTLAKARSDEPERCIAPWAINFIVHPSNKRVEEDLKLIKRHQPPIVITSLGHPGQVVGIVQEYGGLVFSDVSNLKHARKAAQTGVDGLILVCNGAGGHAGTIHPFAFIREVREFWNGLTILAGCLSNGQDILAAETVGADLAYMGTRFLAVSESLASREYQDMLIQSSLEDLIYTDAFSGVNGNYLIPSIRRAGLDPELLQKKGSMDFSLADQAEVKAWRDIWSAGQGVGSIKRVQAMAEAVAELQKEYEQALQVMLEKRPKNEST